jgi:hypothetical protein
MAVRAEPPLNFSTLSANFGFPQLARLPAE